MSSIVVVRVISLARSLKEMFTVVLRMFGEGTNSINDRMPRRMSDRYIKHNWPTKRAYY